MPPDSLLPPLAPVTLPADLLSTVQAAHETCGDLFRLPLGAHTLTIVCHPELAHEVLVAQPEVFAKLGADGTQTGLSRVLGRGLLTNPDTASWFAQRRVVQPAFHPARLARMTATILAAGERLVARWQQLGTETVDVWQAMMQLAREVIYQLSFSLGPAEAARHPLEVPLELATARNRQVREARARLEAVVYALITARREDYTRGEKLRDDLLDLLLAAKDADTGRGMSDVQLCDELLTVFAAGLETTANALTWAWHLLAQHPTVQERLYAELLAASPEDAPGRVPLLTGVFEETLRLYPVIPLAPRVTLRQTTLAGYTIPKGSRVFVSIHTIHRHKGLWDAPERFEPERFLATGKPHPLAFMPFGAGRRFCVGKHLAMLMGPLLLGLMVRGVRLEPLPGHTVTKRLAISLSPKGGLPLRVVARAPRGV